MISHVYSIYDHKTAGYGSLFLAMSDVVAQRLVQSAADSSSMLSKFPEDYTLYAIGQFDDSNGMLSALPERRVVCQLAELIGR